MHPPWLILLATMGWTTDREVPENRLEREAPVGSGYGWGWGGGAEEEDEK